MEIWNAETLKALQPHRVHCTDWWKQQITFFSSSDQQRSAVLALEFVEVRTDLYLVLSSFEHAREDGAALWGWVDVLEEPGSPAGAVEQAVALDVWRLAVHLNTNHTWVSQGKQRMEAKKKGTAWVTHRPGHSDGGRSEHDGVLQLDSHLSQLSLHLPVVHPLTRGTHVLRPDRLRDGAGVAQAVGVDRSDDEQVDGVGKKACDGVCFHLHHVCYSLPCAACWLTVWGLKGR